MKIKYLDQVGSTLTEYAVILSFIAALAISFTGDGNLGSSISNAMNTIVAVFDETNHKTNDMLNNTSKLLTDKYLNGGSNDIYGDSRTDDFSIIGSDDKLLGLENGEYELVIDRKKLDEIAKTYGVNNIETNFWVCVLLYAEQISIPAVNT